MSHRPLYEIAREIRADWGNVYFGAAPYLQAMSSLTHHSDMYGYDSGSSVIRYFLSNAKNWRGEKARQIKAELKAMIE